MEILQNFRVLIHLRLLDNDHLGRALAAIRRAPYVSNDVADPDLCVLRGRHKQDRVKNGPPYSVATVNTAPNEFGAILTRLGRPRFARLAHTV